MPSHFESSETMPINPEWVKIGADIEHKKRILKSMTEEVRQGRGTVSPERLTAMEEAIGDKQRHLEELMSQKTPEQPAAIRKIENESQYVHMTERVDHESEELERELSALYKHRSDPEVVAVFRVVRERMLHLRDQYENLSQAMPADSRSRLSTHIDEERIKNRFIRMLLMDVFVPDSPSVQRHMDAAAYDSSVAEILSDVVTLQSSFEYALKRGLTREKLQMLHDGLDAAQEKLQALDEESEHAAESKERRALMQRINDIRKEYPFTMEEILPGRTGATSPGLSSARDTHRRVVASYTAIQHTLTIDQRRTMRTRIATLSGLVRQAEAEHAEAIAARVRAVISRATEHAPAIALASSAVVRQPTTVSQRSGPLASLVSAFRLK
jgi:hypothetical protein